MSSGERVAELETLAERLAAARREGIYECDPDWKPIDDSLRELGYNPTPLA